MNKILDPVVEQEKLDKQADITDLRAKYERLTHIAKTQNQLQQTQLKNEMNQIEQNLLEKKNKLSQQDQDQNNDDSLIQWVDRKDFVQYTLDQLSPEDKNSDIGKQYVSEFNELNDKISKYSNEDFKAVEHYQQKEQALNEIKQSTYGAPSDPFVSETYYRQTWPEQTIHKPSSWITYQGYKNQPSEGKTRRQECEQYIQHLEKITNESPIKINNMTAGEYEHKYEVLEKEYQNLTSQNPTDDLGKFNPFKRHTPLVLPQNTTSTHPPFQQPPATDYEKFDIPDLKQCESYIQDLKATIQPAAPVTESKTNHIVPVTDIHDSNTAIPVHYISSKPSHHKPYHYTGFHHYSPKPFRPSFCFHTGFSFSRPQYSSLDILISNSVSHLTHAMSSFSHSTAMFNHIDHFYSDYSLFVSCRF